MKIEEQAGETRSLRRTPTLRLKMEEESPQPRNVGSLYKAGNSTQLRASKETGPQSYNHKELNSGRQRTSFSLRTPRKQCSLLTLDCILMRPCQAPDLQNCKMTSLKFLIYGNLLLQQQKTIQQVEHYLIS